MKLDKQIYYSNDFDKVVSFKNKHIIIDEHYNYSTTNPIKKFFAWFSYRFLATPYAFITYKVIKRVKFHNLGILKDFKNTGYFIYANHTNQFADGICPTLICYPQKPHIIVDSSNLSMPIVGKIIKHWGAFPIPSTTLAVKNFYSAMESTLKNNNPILIYPEAHLWPYYTKIRNFPTSSFRYPIKFNTPVFTFTTVYKKRKHFKNPKVEIYVDGPIYFDTNLNEKEAQKKLRDDVYNKLSERANLSDCEFIQYIKRSEHD